MTIQGKIDKPYGAGLKIITKEVTIPGAYEAGGVATEVTELKKVHDAYVMGTPEGYGADTADISGRAFKIKLYYCSGASGTPMVEVADGYTDVSGKTVKVLVIGE